MIEPEAPIRIKKELGTDVKFIFILRNPADRSISAFWHLYKRKIHGTLNWYENRSASTVFNSSIKDLGEFITHEKLAIQESLVNKKIHTREFELQYDTPTWPFSYVENSRYRIFIERYLEHFDKSQMLFLTTEELKQDSLSTFKNIASFLNIDDSTFSNTSKRFNQSVIPKKGFFNDLVHLAHPYVIKTPGFRSRKLDNKYREMYFLAPENSVEITNFLNQLFKQENRLLGNLINKDLEQIWGNHDENG